MYLVFGTYISFRVSFPTNVTRYKFCMLDKTRKRHRRRVRVFLAKKRISPRSLFFAVFFSSLAAPPPPAPSLSLAVPLLFPSSCPSSLYLFLSAGNGIATALPVVPKGIWNARATRDEFLLQRHRSMLAAARQMGARIWRRRDTGIRERREIREKEKDSAMWRKEAGGLLGVSVNPLRLIKVRLVLLGIGKILSFFSFSWNFLPSRPLPFLQYRVLSSFLPFSKIFFSR